MRLIFLILTLLSAPGVFAGPAESWVVEAKRVSAFIQDVHGTLKNQSGEGSSYLIGRRVKVKVDGHVVVSQYFLKDCCSEQAEFHLQRIRDVIEQSKNGWVKLDYREGLTSPLFIQNSNIAERDGLGIAQARAETERMERQIADLSLRLTAAEENRREVAVATESIDLLRSRLEACQRKVDKLETEAKQTKPPAFRP
ncbi:MAG: hypothetical protein AB7P04_08505 [Bacteriovoracia bacterium]